MQVAVGLKNNDYGGKARSIILEDKEEKPDTDEWKQFWEHLGGKRDLITLENIPSSFFVHIPLGHANAFYYSFCHFIMVAVVVTVAFADDCFFSCPFRKAVLPLLMRSPVEMT